MQIDLSNWSVSDFAAWWGAIIATLALAWNIVVAFRSGARIRVRVTPNMQVYPRQPITEDNEYISVTVVNHGTSPTTITHFCGYYATSLWNHIRRKRQHFVIPSHPALGMKVPYVLSPGQEWSSLADQRDLHEKSKGGYLYIGVIHNQSKRPVYKKVIFHP